MSLTFAENLTKMIDAGLGGEVIAPDTSVAVGYRMQYNLVSGPVASWNDPEGGFPINLVTAIEPIQGGTGDPSPENVRPISGRTFVDIWHDATHDTSADPTLTIQLGDTIYGGSLDVVSGVLTVDREIVTYNGSEYWRGNVTNGIYFANNAVKRAANYSGKIICDKLPTGATPGSTIERPFITAYSVANIYPGQNWIYLLFPIDQYSSWADVKAWLAENPIQVCYELAQPLTVQLSPQTINSLLGQNNVWSDTGDVSVTWKEKLYTEGY